MSYYWINRKIGHYIDNYDTILPSDSEIPSIANTTWYQFIKPLFDDKVWNDFYDREIFDGDKFDKETESDLKDVVVKTIKIHLKSKARIYDRMFNAYMADFNPLWNVDGVVGEIRETTHTGTDTDAHTGKDTTLTEDKGNITKSGNESDLHTGSKSNVRTGSITTNDSGSDVTTNQKTTFNDNHFNDTDKSTLQHGKNESETFNNLTDTETYNNQTDTHTYNNVKDTRNLNGKNETTFSSQLQKTLNLKDKDIAMTIRQGNIGVTRSDELISKAMEMFESDLYDFVHYVVNDCLNQVCYAIY